MNEACAAVKQESEFDKILVEFDDQLKRMEMFSSEIENRVKALGYFGDAPSPSEKENPIPSGIVGAFIQRLQYLRVLNNSLLDSKEGLQRLVG